MCLFAVLHFCWFPSSPFPLCHSLLNLVQDVNFQIFSCIEHYIYTSNVDMRPKGLLVNYCKYFWVSWRNCLVAHWFQGFGGFCMSCLVHNLWLLLSSGQWEHCCFCVCFVLFSVRQCGLTLIPLRFWILRCVIRSFLLFVSFQQAVFSCYFSTTSCFLGTYPLFKQGDNSSIHQELIRPIDMLLEFYHSLSLKSHRWQNIFSCLAIAVCFILFLCFCFCFLHPRNEFTKIVIRDCLYHNDGMLKYAGNFPFLMDLKPICKTVTTLGPFSSGNLRDCFSGARLPLFYHRSANCRYFCSYIYQWFEHYFSH